MVGTRRASIDLHEAGTIGEVWTDRGGFREKNGTNYGWLERRTVAAFFSLFLSTYFISPYVGDAGG